MADRGYGPVVLLGLAGGTLTAVAGTREWARATGNAAGITVESAAKGSESAPLVTALALVVLAAWGVVLVLRGRIRPVVAGLGALASMGALVAVVVAFDRAQNDALDSLTGRGTTGGAVATSLTAWYYVAGVGALATALAFLVAVRRSPRWPEMGTTYDAPSARADAPATDEDMWRAIDQGRDPTS